MIIEEIQRCASERVAYDIFIIANRLEERTGQSFIEICVNASANAAPSVDTLKTRLEVIKKKSNIRRAEYIMQNSIEMLRNGDDGAVDMAISNLMALDKGQQKYEWTMHEAAITAINQIEHAYKNQNNGLIGIPTGLKDINEQMGGFHKSDLIVIGARPAMGKTAIMLNMMIGSGVRCGVFSSEQGHDQIAQRAIAIKSGVPVHNMRTGRLEDEHWSAMTAGVASLINSNCIINDNPVVTIQDIQRQSRKWARQDGVKAIFIDYAQRIKSVSQYRDITQLMGEVVPSLKSLARELDIPVIVLAQVKRDVETRTNKRPLMGDLADASIFEKEADQIIMLYRDEVYNPDTEFKGIIELLYEKNRHGPTGGIRAAWIGSCLQVKDLAPDFYTKQ